MPSLMQDTRSFRAEGGKSCANKDETNNKMQV